MTSQRRPGTRPRRPVRRGSTRELARALAACDVTAHGSGRPVRAWLDGREHRVLIVRPGWRAAAGGLWWRRVWSWRLGNDLGWRLRADAAGVARGVAILLVRSAEHDGAGYVDVYGT